MAIEVSTKEQLRDAIKTGEADILITDADLAKAVRNFKRLRNVSKWTLRILCTAGAASTALALAAPATGGMTALPVLALGGPVLVATGVAPSVLVSIIAIATIGTVVMYAIYKDYDIIEVDLPGGIRVRLRKKEK